MAWRTEKSQFESQPAQEHTAYYSSGMRRHSNPQVPRHEWRYIYMPSRQAHTQVYFTICSYTTDR